MQQVEKKEELAWSRKKVKRGKRFFNIFLPLLDFENKTKLKYIMYGLRKAAYSIY